MRAGRQIGFFVDATRCVNCKTCEIACKDFYNSPPGLRLRRVRAFEGGEFPRVFAYNVSMCCNHCADPKCLRHCPAKAYTKRMQDGIVVHDPERCIGCRYCTWVCPYGAPRYDSDAGCVRKCNLCVEELDAGRTPACVSACPTRAIEIGPIEEIAVRAGVTIEIVGLPDRDVSQPSVRYRIRNEAVRR